MEINDYISSGVLELYVAGALSPEESREVEAMANLHSQVRQEIESIQLAFEALAMAPGVHPRPNLRTEILDKIDQLEGVSKSSPGSAGPRPAAVITLPHRTRYLLAASIAVAIMSSACAGYFAYRWKSTESELALLNTENQKIVQQQGALKARLDRDAGDLAVLRQQQNRAVQMKGMPIAPGAMATVYWNQSTREVHLDKGTLPAPPSGKQYQLWAIDAGKPVDAGVIGNGADDGLQRMKDVANADAFAVTLEPEGGSAAPTMDAMYVMGKPGA